MALPKSHLGVIFHQANGQRHLCFLVPQKKVPVKATHYIKDCGNYQPLLHILQQFSLMGHGKPEKLVAFWWVVTVNLRNKNSVAFRCIVCNSCNPEGRVKKLNVRISQQFHIMTFSSVFKRCRLHGKLRLVIKFRNSCCAIIGRGVQLCAY